jgi:hypothetical protein
MEKMKVAFIEIGMLGKILNCIALRSLIKNTRIDQV